MRMPRRHPAVLCAITLVIALSAACTAEQPDAGASFYAEVHVEVEPSPDDPFARVRSADAPESESELRWWYADDPQRWRWEIETVTPDLDAGTRVTLFDGDSMWTYDDRSMTYHEEPDLALPDGLVPSPTFSAQVGPANVATVDEFVARWNDQTDSDARVAGKDTVLGRDVQIVEIRPAWRSSSGSSTSSSDSTSTEEETSGGVVRVAIDPERMFVMRWDVDGEGGGQSYAAEIVHLEYGAEIKDDRFVFDPPPGAVATTEDSSCSSSTGSSAGGSSVDLPPGFLEPRYVPGAFRATGTGSEEDSGCRTSAAWALFEDDADGYLLLQERLRHSLPEALLAWEPATLEDGRDAFRAPAGAPEGLAWHEGDLAILLESDTLSIEELLRIAGSMD